MTIQFQIADATDNSGEIDSLYLSYSWLISGNYLKRGFIPVTKRFPEIPNIVLFPEKHIKFTKTDISELKRYARDGYIIPRKSNIYRYFEKSFDFSFNLSKKTQTNSLITTYITNFSETFTLFIESLFPELKEAHIKIKIYTRSYGTAGSWEKLKQSNNGYEGYVYLRSDSSVEKLPELLFGVFFTDKLDSRYTWAQREAMIEAYVTCYNAFLGKPKDYTSNATKQDTFSLEAIVNSREFLQLYKADIPANIYLSSLGVILTSSGDEIALHNRTDMEILSTMLLNFQNIITYDEIAYIMWKGNSEKFSLAAMNKRMQRLRNILKEYANCNIVSVRKTGYYLVV
ncbi:helix-turn-helix domain-containing protein [Candidatus Nomurabacteria bacterium]|uniref:Helix-turn-helix domain-containing protein n=2 Tax=Bacteria candidate phyla TaxID=1783234 RepID=A0A955RWP7_UNCKA|nr:helix-turn-helix domain-containing protein [Candidatus Dojkabacteria bacterium]MCA9397302.1 helix-turn-helix domain-containing protein [candidate division WWE3 bacterium]MCB9790189.1 helix-turn-helix domain-containing protein [Candidatus Nomurabacteria bacterium]MCB9803291.1 helix-turn-helix domain-containing protein [Candidatus Nomurabacteria bacterium]